MMKDQSSGQKEWKNKQKPLTRDWDLLKGKRIHFAVVGTIAYGLGT